jgi:hypothetical protein
MHHADGEGDPTQAHSHVAHGLVKGRVKDRVVTFISNLNGVNIPYQTTQVLDSIRVTRQAYLNAFIDTARSNLQTRVQVVRISCSEFHDDRQNL